MKKLYTFLLICFVSAPCFSQVYYPMLDSVSNDWYFISNVIPIRVQQSTPCSYGAMFGTATRCFTSGDTTIAGINWKILDNHDYAATWMDCRYGYIREDTAARKIYFMDNLLNPEMLMYDFSMQVGDTIQRSFLYPFGYYQDGTYTVDSISTITINAGPRRIFYLNNHQTFQPTLEWIESVGHPGDLAYLYGCNFPGGGFGFFCTDIIDRNYCQLLTCFEHNAQKVYFDSCMHAYAYNNTCFDYHDSCNYWNICGSLQENNLISNLSISPNPANETATIVVESRKHAEVNLDVMNVYGSSVIGTKITLAQGKNENQLDIRNLASGFYFVTVRSGTEIVAGKLVKAER